MYQSWGEQLAAIQAQLRQTSAQTAAGLEQLNKTDENELLNMNTSYDYEHIAAPLAEAAIHNHMRCSYSGAHFHPFY